MSKNENKNRPPSQTGGQEKRTNYSKTGQTGGQEKRTNYSKTGQTGHSRSRTSQRPRPTKLQKEQFKTRD